MLPTQKTRRRSPSPTSPSSSTGRARSAVDLVLQRRRRAVPATEAGLNNLEVFQAPIGSWDELLAACKEIAEGSTPTRR
jgi:hypothetical protein